MNICGLSESEYYNLYGMYEFEEAKSMVIERYKYLKKYSFLPESQMKYIRSKTKEILLFVDQVLHRKRIATEDDLERKLSAAIIATSNLQIYINDHTLYNRTYKKEHRKSWKNLRKKNKVWMRIYFLLGERTWFDLFMEGNTAILSLIASIFSCACLFFLMLESAASEKIFPFVVYFIGFLIAMPLIIILMMQLHIRSYVFDGDKMRKLRNKHLIRIRRKRTKIYAQLSKALDHIEKLK